MILEKTQRKTESSVDGAAITGKWFAKKEQLKGNVMNSKDKMNFPSRFMAAPTTLPVKSNILISLNYSL